jgi:hypothetical protein
MVLDEALPMKAQPGPRRCKTLAIRLEKYLQHSYSHAWHIPNLPSGASRTGLTR